ncbi:MAG: hypothetical protein ABI488_04585 [Polyangiaceae bacterium]
MPGLQASRRQLEALPSSVPALERARLEASVGLSSEAQQTFRDVFGAPDVTAAEAAEATWLSLRLGDAATDAFFGRLLTAFERQLSAIYSPSRSL